MPRSRLYIPDVERYSNNPEISLEFNTFDTNFNTFYTYLLPVGRVVSLELQLQANEGGNNFAMFGRKGMFWRDNVDVKFRNGWVSLVDDKTSRNFEVKYLTTGQYVLLQAKSHTINRTHWKAILRWSQVNG